MAGKHRVVVSTPRVCCKVYLPQALKAHLEDQAVQHGLSLNEEITRRLSGPRRSKRTIRQKLMELEPLASEPAVPISEIATTMERINPYRPSRNGSELRPYGPIANLGPLKRAKQCATAAPAGAVSWCPPTRRPRSDNSPDGLGGTRG